MPPKQNVCLLGFRMAIEEGDVWNWDVVELGCCRTWLESMCWTLHQHYCTCAGSSSSVAEIRDEGFECPVTWVSKGDVQEGR